MAARNSSGSGDAADGATHAAADLDPDVVSEDADGGDLPPTSDTVDLKSFAALRGRQPGGRGATTESRAKHAGRAEDFSDMPDGAGIKDAGGNRTVAAKHAKQQASVVKGRAVDLTDQTSTDDAPASDTDADSSAGDAESAAPSATKKADSAGGRGGAAKARKRVAPSGASQSGGASSGTSTSGGNRSSEGVPAKDDSAKRDSAVSDAPGSGSTGKRPTKNARSDQDAAAEPADGVAAAAATQRSTSTEADRDDAAQADVAAEAAPAAGGDDSDDVGPWRRLAQALSPQFQRGQLLGAALCALLGFALVVQVRHTQNTNDLTGLRGEELVRLLADLDSQSERLELERSALERDQEQLRNTSNLQGVAQRQAEERRQRLAVLAGTVPTFGPGVLISIKDPQGEVNQRHVLSAVQELRGAGAEAIAVNNVRLVSSSSFAQKDGHVVVDGVKLSSPYVIQAIGSAETIGPALQMHGGVHATISQLPGADIDITEKARVTISAVRDADGQVISQPDPGGGQGSTPS